MEDIQERMDAIGVFEIRNFLRTYPLEPSPAFDQNIHNPGEKRGTTILPLWQQTNEFRDGSTHWPAFTRLLAVLKPYVLCASAMFAITHSEEYRKARVVKERRLAAQNPALAIPHGSADNCFETVRLSANIAPTSCPLQTTHPSKLASFAVIGRRLFNGGGIAVPALGTLHALMPGGFLVLDTAMEVHTTPFSGERYELQFFIPELDD
jgi:hypothetical protein